MRISKALLLTTANTCYMADPAPTPPVSAPAPDAKKAETVAESMDQRRTFATVEEAATYLNLCAESYSDFDNYPLVARGMDGGNFDPAVYSEGMHVLVAVLKNRAKDDKGNPLPSTVKAIVVTPVPSRELILSNPAALSWLDSLIGKELNHIAVRALRNADDVTTVADQMPQTLNDYITSSRAEGGIMETFDSLFKAISAAIGVKSPAWAKARLIKTELKRAMESAAYAREYYPQLEDRGDKPSMFVLALQFGQAVAAKKTLNPAIFDKWLAERDGKTLKQTADAGDDDFDLDDLELIEEAPAATADAAPEAEATPEPEPTEENTTPAVE